MDLLLQDVEKVAGSFRVWFTRENSALLFDDTDRRWVDGLTLLLRRIATELRDGIPSFSIAENDAADILNSLQPFVVEKDGMTRIDASLLEMMLQRRIFYRASDGTAAASDDFEYWLRHASMLTKLFPQVLRRWMTQLPEDVRLRLHPSWQTAFDAPSVFEDGVTHEKLSDAVVSHDPFKTEKAFRVMEGSFVPAVLDSIPDADRFFGFESLRAQIKNFFDDFIAERSNVPLLISGLPGIGKTHLPIAEVFARSELTLILAGPESLTTPFESILKRLAARPYRKFVLFFDDIDPRKLDWYHFRTHVGGSYALPQNVTLVISSNYLFPANVLSRGRGCKFPLFDHIRCTEMIHDFLLRMGIKRPPENLITVMAADYTELCGQRQYEDLSPRTLMRYLNTYQHDTEKRKRMLDYSNANVISRPDPDLFFDSNIRRMRALYGESSIDELREQMLQEYGL